MTYLFSTEKINSGRQKELDFAKGLAIIFMIIGGGLVLFRISKISKLINNKFTKRL